MAVKPFVPRDAPAGEVAAAFAIFFTAAWLLVFVLEKKKIVIRV